MPLKIVDQGQNNTILVPDAGRTDCDGVITFEGDRNRVEIGRIRHAANLRIRLGSDCTVAIGRDCNLGAVELFAKSRSTVTIGDRCAFTHHTRIFLHEPGRIDIGSHCLIASGSLLTNSDMHTIFDLETGERINPAESVRVGDRVWLGADAVVLKGSVIGDGSIVGFRSVVTGQVPENSAAAGIPARVVRRGVSWSTELSG